MSLPRKGHHSAMQKDIILLCFYASWYLLINQISLLRHFLINTLIRNFEFSSPTYSNIVFTSLSQTTLKSLSCFTFLTHSLRECFLQHLVFLSSYSMLLVFPNYLWLHGQPCAYLSSSPALTASGQNILPSAFHTCWSLTPQVHLLLPRMPSSPGCPLLTLTVWVAGLSSLE